MTRRVFRHKPLPRLGIAAEREVVDEFRRVESWGLDVNLRLDQRPPWSGRCPTDDKRIPYYDCADDDFKPTTLYYDPSPSVQPGFPAVISDADLLFLADRAIAFTNMGGDELLGGIGNVQQHPDILLLVGTSDITQWDDPTTRRPLVMGGSEVAIDAGTTFDMQLPGVVGYEHGYDLQLGSDGLSVLAIPNPAPDFNADDTSDSHGDILVQGTGGANWTDFPYDNPSAADGLSVVVPAGTEAGLLIINISVGVINLSTRSGSLSIGVGFDGANPAAGYSRFFTIPAEFSGFLTVSLNHSFAETLPADVTVAVMYAGQGSHQQFLLETDTTDGQHELDVRITRGGGTAPGNGIWGQGGFWQETIQRFTDFPAATWVIIDVDDRQLYQNIGVQTGTSGFIQILQTPAKFVRVHATVSVKPTENGKTMWFRPQFNNGNPAGGVVKSTAPSFTPELTIAFSMPVVLPLESNYIGIAMYVETAAIQAILDVFSFSFWLEYE